MSLLDTGELATGFCEFLLSRRGIVMSYIPQSEGWLPRWQLIVAVMAFFNAAQNFVTLKLTRRIYGNVAPPLGSNPMQYFSSRGALTGAHSPSSDGVAGEDLRGLDCPLRCRAPLCRLQHQS